MAWMVSTDFTQKATDHLTAVSAKLASSGYSSRSLVRFETAQPSAHIVEKSVKEREKTYSGVCRSASRMPSSGLRRVKKLRRQHIHFNTAQRLHTVQSSMRHLRCR